MCVLNKWCDCILDLTPTPPGLYVKIIISLPQVGQVPWQNGNNQGIKNNLGYKLDLLNMYIIHVVTNLYKINLHVLT